MIVERSHFQEPTSAIEYHVYQSAVYLNRARQRPSLPRMSKAQDANLVAYVTRE